MHLLYIGLGSNLGDRHAHMNRALRLVGEQVGRVVCVSSFRETVPQGFHSNCLFLNAVACVETELSPQQCLAVTQAIERQMGRTRKSVDGQYHDRVIDIDLLLYDDWTVQEPDLIIPHPRMRERDFVLTPLRELGLKGPFGLP